MYQPPQPHIPEPPTRRVKLLAALSFAFATLLTFILVILGFMIVDQHRSYLTLERSLQLTEDVLQKTNDELTKTRRALITEQMLPPLDSFPSQCPNGNQDDGLFTPLSTTPIESYAVFTVDCRSYIGTGKSQPRVIIFRINNDGSREYTYGANDKEPLCITNKIPIAERLGERLKLPVCQSN